MSKSEEAAGRFRRLAAGANAGRWSVLGAAVLWGTTGTAATFAPRGSSSLALGAAAMGIGGVALFIGAGRSALRLITRGLGGSVLLPGAGWGGGQPLAVYTSVAGAR